MKHKLDDLFAKYATNMGEAVINDDFGFGSTDTGNVSHVVPTIHPHIKIGSRNLVGHTHRFREAAGSAHGDQALIRGAKVLERSEEHTSELQSRFDLVCRLLLEKK